MAALERREWRLIPGVPVAGKLPERLLAGRGYGEPAAAACFLRPSLDHLHDPFLMPDLERACTLVGQALAGREPILIHGDYDVDGITATALLACFFRDIGAECATLIPDRLADGYGLTAASVEAVLQSGCKLLITVDCGTTSFDEVARLNQAGIPVIVTDHHDCRETLPEAAAVVNPKRADSAYPFANLAGVGVALKFLQGLCLKMDLGDLWQKHLDLAALGTVADIMPLRDENRILVAAGLEQLNSLPGSADRLSTGRAPYRRTFGLGVLLQSAGQTDRPATAQTLGYLLAPRINASGRLGDAADALSLLLTEDQATADQQASLLNELNRRRQEIETAATAEAMLEIDSRFDFSGSDFIVAAKPNWHPGVIGIVASRLAEQYCRPAIVLTGDEEGYRGSCRTWGDVDILAALNAVSGQLIRFGGHRKAAGLTLAADRLDAFRLALGQYAAEHAGLFAAQPVLNADAEAPGAESDPGQRPGDPADGTFRRRESGSVPDLPEPEPDRRPPGRRRQAPEAELSGSGPADRPGCHRFRPGRRSGLAEKRQFARYPVQPGSQ